MENKLTVLYEDNQVIVVVKPQNVPTQADSSGDVDLLTMVKQYVKEKYDKPGEAFIGLVHRLDRPTGGVMVFARNSKSAARLQEQMKSGLFEKKYLAVTVGVPRDRQGRLSQYLFKDAETNTVKVVPAAVEGADRIRQECRCKVWERPSSVTCVTAAIRLQKDTTSRFGRTNFVSIIQPPSSRLCSRFFRPSKTYRGTFSPSKVT